MIAYPNPTQSQLDRIARANLSIAQLIGTFENSINEGSAELTKAIYNLDVPGIRGMRARLIEQGNACADAGLVVHEDAPPVEPPGRTVWENTKDWEDFALSFAAGGVVTESNRLVQTRAAGGLQTLYQGRAGHELNLDDVLFEPKDLAQGSKWGIRAYNVAGVLRGLIVRGMGLVTRDAFGNITYLNEGHAVYGNTIGTFEIDQAIISGNGGQAYQEATRPHLGPDSITPRVGLTYLHHSKFRENGYLVDPNGGPTISGGDRSSDPVSINGGGDRHDVTIQDVTIETLYGPEFNYSAGVANSRGAIKLLADSWTQGRENLAVANGITQDPGEPPWKASGWAYGNVVVTDCDIRLRNSDRAALFLRGAKSATIQGNSFEDEGDREIRIELDPEHNPGGILPTTKDGTPLQPCGSLVWRNNTGPGEVRYRGEVVGPIEGEYVFEGGVRKT